MTDLPIDVGADVGDIPIFRWRNHPRRGIDYPDMTPGMVEPATSQRIVTALLRTVPAETEIIAGIDIGGLGLAGAMGFTSGRGFFEIRKIDSIRPEVMRTLVSNYMLGDRIVFSRGAQVSGRRVLVVDDCLMSGGTALAAVRLLREAGATVSHTLFVFEIEGLGGREALAREGVTVDALRTVPARDE